MRGYRPSARLTAAPSARSCSCCANTSPPPVTNWSARTATTGSPAPAWAPPDRPARASAYQVLVLDELDRFGVTVTFTDSPGLAADDPQATLLTQVQGVIAEYEKAKIAERYRRGKLFRARAGEIVTWKASYGYRRIPRSTATGAAHHEIYEPEAAVA